MKEGGRILRPDRARYSRREGEPDLSSEGNFCSSDKENNTTDGKGKGNEGSIQEKKGERKRRLVVRELLSPPAGAFSTKVSKKEGIGEPCLP